MPFPVNPSHQKQLPSPSYGKRPRENEKGGVTEVAHQQLKKQRTEHRAESFLPLNEACTLYLLTFFDNPGLRRIAQVSRRASELAKQVISARQQAMKSLPPSSHPLNNDCIFHFLTFLDFRDLWEVARVNRQMNVLAMKVMHVIGKDVLGQRFLLQHNDSLSTVQHELSMLKRELENLVKETQDEMELEQTVKSAQEEGLEQIKALIKDRIDTRKIRGSIDNLSNLSMENILNIFASKTLSTRYPRVVNALAIHCCLSQKTRTFDGLLLESVLGNGSMPSADVLRSLNRTHRLAFKGALDNAVFHNQPNVLRCLFKRMLDPIMNTNETMQAKQNKDGLFHVFVEEKVDLSFINTLTDVIDPKKLKVLIESENQVGDTPLLLSINNEQAFRCLIKAGANPLHRNQAGQTLIHLATKHGNYSYLKLVLEELTALGFKKEDLLEAKDRDRWTPLFYITQFKVPDAEEKLRLFLSMEANVRDESDVTILHYAAGSANVSVDLFRLIVQQRPDLINEQEDIEYQTPIFDAINDPKKLKILIQHGADIHHRACEGASLLYHALGNPKALENLLAYNFDINVPEDGEGRSLLFLSLPYRQDFDLLIKNGANIYHKDLYERSLLHQAAEEASFAMLQRVLELGLNLEEQDDEGRTPIFYAVKKLRYGGRESEREDLETLQKLELLLGQGANVYHQTKEGKTIFDLAEEIKDQRLDELLAKYKP
ncbi:MAG: ankyrin repeat domain-containing protein [Parachlamydiaceae bacterium]